MSQNDDEIIFVTNVKRIYFCEMPFFNAAKLERRFRAFRARTSNFG